MEWFHVFKFYSVSYDYLQVFPQNISLAFAIIIKTLYLIQILCLFLRLLKIMFCFFLRLLEIMYGFTRTHLHSDSFVMNLSESDTTSSLSATMPTAADQRSRIRVLKENFETYCKETSLHGWHYMSAKLTLRSTIWSVTLIMSIGLSGYFLIRNYSEYSNSTTVTSIDSKTAPLSDLYFPGVIICNVNQGN